MCKEIYVCILNVLHSVYLCRFYWVILIIYHKTVPHQFSNKNWLNTFQHANFWFDFFFWITTTIHYCKMKCKSQVFSVLFCSQRELTFLFICLTDHKTSSCHRIMAEQLHEWRRGSTQQNWKLQKIKIEEGEALGVLLKWCNGECTVWKL